MVACLPAPPEALKEFLFNLSIFLATVARGDMLPYTQPSRNKGGRMSPAAPPKAGPAGPAHRPQLPRWAFNWLGTNTFKN